MAFEQKQFISAMKQIGEEKGISEDRVKEAVEAALAAAYKKDYGKKGQKIRIELDNVTGDTKVFLQREVVKVDIETNEITERAKREDAEIEEEEENNEEKEEKKIEYNPERYVTLEEAQEKKKDAKVGDVIEEQLEAHNTFGRIAAQTAKQVIIQKIREEERKAMFEEYKDKVGQVVNGTVQRLEGRNVIVDLGRSTGILFPDEQIRGEKYYPGQRLKVFLKRVESGAKGPGITLSRASEEIVRELFKMEVPEVNSGVVIIKGIAREAGSRTKMSVATQDENIDPVGACVGQQGTRVQPIINELNGEKIDIIKWEDDPVRYIKNALSPAIVLNVKLDEKERETKVEVTQDQLSLAIGKQGQNVRLASKLVGWKIDVNAAEDEESQKAEDNLEENKDEEKKTEELNSEKNEKEVEEKKEEK